MPTPPAQRSTSLADMTGAPEQFWQLSQTEAFGVPLDAVKDFQLAALRHRFEQLVPAIPVVRRLAAEQNIARIDDVADVAPLLLKHSVYKSYPISLIETAKYDRLTRWLDNLTVHDLGDVRTDGVDSIDGWIDALDAQSIIRVRHSSGTTGKLSFLPSARNDALLIQTWRFHHDGVDDEPRLDEASLKTMPFIYPSYRRGAMATHRRMDALQACLFEGDPDMIDTMHDGRLSADMLSLAGRLQAANARGEAGQVGISDDLLRRREQFVAAQKRSALDAAAFFQALPARFANRRVQMLGYAGQLYDMAVAGIAEGHEKIFAPDSVVMMGGGTKGRDLPQDWRATVQRYLGVDGIRDSYGMTELSVAIRACRSGHYHLPAVYIGFVLDPATGEVLPSTGEQRGRFGVYDLTRDDIWGGFLTGDAVTVRWGDTNPCDCGRVGPYLMNDIRRFSEMEGGDDKVSCAGAPAAHDHAMEFLNDL